MKTLRPNYFSGLLLGVLLITVIPLWQRVKEESQDRRVAIAVEWNEYRDFNARLARHATLLLKELREHGVTALVITPLTLSDLLQQHQVQPLGPSRGSDPLDVSRLQLTDAELGRHLIQQWNWQNVSDIKLQTEGTRVTLTRSQGTFESLKDADIGFDRQLLRQVRNASIVPVLRVNSNPWLDDASWVSWLNDLPLTEPDMGILFSTDELPGGPSQIALWKSRLQSPPTINLLTEFRPSSAARQVAYALPSQTYRIHSIPITELKDLMPDQQLARWHRAVEERSCRLLLMRIGPNDSPGWVFSPTL